MAEGRGWKVRRIKIDDGCYEIYFRDADGAEFEARINPATLEIIKIESESMDESHDIVPIEGDMKKSEEND